MEYSTYFEKVPILKLTKYPRFYDAVVYLTSKLDKEKQARRGNKGRDFDGILNVFREVPILKLTKYCAVYLQSRLDKEKQARRGNKSGNIEGLLM